MRQISHGAFDLALRRFKLGMAHQRRGTPQTPAGTVDDRDDHRQIPQQFIGWRWWLGQDLLTCF
jgi:hypothetical protein